jgi:hypothetical protein
MDNIYALSDPNCTSCIGAGKTLMTLNQGKPFGQNIYKIPEPFTSGAIELKSLNFFGYSLFGDGYLVCKINETKIELQPIKFNNMGILPLNEENKYLGV